MTLCESLRVPTIERTVPGTRALAMETLIATLLLIALAWTISSRRRRTLGVPLPPSPPADPILGHLRYIPSQNPELQYTEWAKSYGDVIYLRILNRPIIVLNTMDAVIDLFEKKSWNYSDRPDFPIFNLFGTSVVQIAFGHDMDSENGPNYDDLIRGNGDTLTTCGPPGGTLVDLFPVCTTTNERLQQEHGDGFWPDDNDVKGAASLIFAAGSDTLWSTLSVFMLAMVLCPESQEKAQKELDMLLLGSHLPELGDWKALPYIKCVVQETYQ
ncbi:cytochrome P450 [Macrolepiota fuliginosa MF-IS2]|uniref:Cytochrome P450 n=1 Tax=Macrolepiota fuliginosa MF-IS2 TaxID=1400762 RepID=A0A9P5WYY3_9AGAR|nr:cytochrome P450 [Macrolepiota fuliginosa MF-IS2]